MNVVIAGGGSVGRFLAEQLHTSGHGVTVIESDRRVTAEHSAEPQLAGVTWLTGDACDMDVLSAAGLTGATVVAAVTGDDEDNLVISLLAKQEFGMPRVIARVNNPRNEWMFGEMWGVDVPVSTPHLLASLVQEAVGVDNLVRLLPFGDGRTRIVEVVVATSSVVADVEIARVGFPRDTSVVAVLRAGRVVVPRGDTTLRPGDKVVVLVTDDSEAATAALFGDVAS